MQKRVSIISGLRALEITEDAESLTQAILAQGVFPLRAVRDAAHVAVATVHAEFQAPPQHRKRNPPAGEALTTPDRTLKTENLSSSVKHLKLQHQNPRRHAKPQTHHVPNRSEHQIKPASFRSDNDDGDRVEAARHTTVTRAGISTIHRCKTAGSAESANRRPPSDA